MNPLSNEPGSRGSEVAEKIKIIGTAVGIVSALAAVATFIGFKPEKKKVIEWEYISKSSLVNPATPATEKIQVSYDGRQIKQLTVVTAKLSNTGALSVEGSDEMYPTVKFSEKVIRADTKEPNRLGVRAEAQFDEHSVEIRHGLLNPGDSIPIEILIEGDPGKISGFPPVLYRISGIEQPVTRYPAPVQARVGIAYFDFGRPIEYLILIFASFVPLLFSLLVAAGIGLSVESMYPERKLVKILKNPASVSVREGNSAQEKLAKALYVDLPSPLDKAAEKLVRETNQNPGDSQDDYVVRVTTAVKSQVMPTGISERLQRLDKGAVVVFATTAVLTIASVLVAIGSWHRLIVSV